MKFKGKTWAERREDEMRWRWWRDPEFWVYLACGAAGLFLAIATGGRYLFPGIIE